MSDITTILSTLQSAVDDLTASAAGKQPALYKQLMAMVKNLDAKGDALTSNINNLKLINKIKVTLEKLIIDDKYKAAVKKFISAYNDVQDLLNQYFSQFAGYKNRNVSALKNLTKTAIETTINNLTETGLEAGVTDPLRKILFTNVNAGGSYADLTEQLRSYMLTDGKNLGALERYISTYATTAINQFSAEYNKSLADDLGLEWYMYDGSLLATSREFCILAVQKKYIHVSEFDTLLSGNFGSLGTCHINKSTGLPDGMMAGTDDTNFIRRRGGWNCGHQMIAVDTSIVPMVVQQQVYATAAYKKWAAAA